MLSLCDNIIFNISTLIYQKYRILILTYGFLLINRNKIQMEGYPDLHNSLDIIGWSETLTKRLLWVICNEVTAENE